MYRAIFYVEPLKNSCDMLRMRRALNVYRHRAIPVDFAVLLVVSVLLVALVRRVVRVPQLLVVRVPWRALWAAL